MKYWLAILLLLSAPIWAGHQTITSLPAVINQTSHSADLWDTLFLVDTDTTTGHRLTSVSSGITITGGSAPSPNHWFVWLKNDTIDFGIANGVNNRGISLVGGSATKVPNFGYIYGGVIRNKCTVRNDSLVEKNSACLWLRWNNQTAKACTLVADGFNGRCVETQDNEYNTKLSRGNYSSLVTHYTSRCNEDGAIIKAYGSFNYFPNYLDSGWTYNIEVESLTIWNSPNSAIYTCARPSASANIILIHDNDISVDSRNDLYPTNAGVCASSANSYGIHLVYAKDGSRIYNNYVHSGTTHHGGRGMYTSGSRRYNLNDSIYVYNNSCTTHTGVNAEYSTEENYCAQSFLARGSGVGLSVHDNNFVTITDADGGTAYTTAYAYAGRYAIEIPTVAGSDTIRNSIRNNHFTALGSGVSTFNDAFLWEAYCRGGNASDSNLWDTSSRFLGNVYESDREVIKICRYQNGANGIVSIGDTFKISTPAIDTVTFNIGDPAGSAEDQCLDNIFRDGVYLGGASDTNIIFGADAIGDKEIFIQRTLSILVKDNGGNPVNNVNIWAINNYGTTIMNVTTGGDGLGSGIATYWYESQANPDSLAFNPFTIWAKKGGDSVSVSLNIDMTHASDTLTLPIGGTTAVYKKFSNKHLSGYRL